MGKTRPQREMGHGFGTADLVEARPPRAAPAAPARMTDRRTLSLPEMLRSPQPDPHLVVIDSNEECRSDPS